MKFEVAIEHLKEGKRIYREKTPEDFLEGTKERVRGSYNLTIFDVLANDWRISFSQEESE